MAKSNLAIRVPPGAIMLEDNAQYKNRMQIPSESSGNLYTVAQRKSSGKWTCSCRGWIAHRHCKHLESVGLRADQIDGCLEMQAKKNALR